MKRNQVTTNFMTTLCRCDWIEAQAKNELQLARIDLENLPTTSLDKMAVVQTSNSYHDSRNSTCFDSTTPLGVHP